MQKNAHCSYCGHAFAPDQPWPRACAGCGNLTFRNPTPVAVVLLPVEDGVLAIRRGIEPARGQLALPGGFMDFGESWQAAGVRELFEETGIRIEEEEILEFLVRSTPDGGIVIVFGIAARGNLGSCRRLCRTKKFWGGRFCPGRWNWRFLPTPRQSRNFSEHLIEAISSQIWRPLCSKPNTFTWP